MTVVTRFAPSPTGFMHIGNARTALFNYLFARHMGGKFLLRIEDTDRERSTQPAIDAIFESLKWMGLEWDGEAVLQSTRLERHTEVAKKLLEMGKAYPCYCSPQELEAMREKARLEKRTIRYDGTWRDRDPSEAPKGVSPVIRFKAPLEGETVVHDKVKGTITVQNDQLDDMVLLRSDGTPTYMLSVVVDDHDMGITHVIRGADHMTNTFRQKQLFQAMGWDVPEYSHIPLIHGADGTKLSKRHGALGTEDYKNMGFLPEAMCNYLLRLGWSHGNDEIISKEQAVEWFNLESVQKSPARFDVAKLTNLNGNYLREAGDERLLSLIQPELEKIVGKKLDDSLCRRLRAGMPELKQRAKTVNELAECAQFYVHSRPIPMDEKAKQDISEDSIRLLRNFYPILSTLERWSHEEIEAVARKFAEDQGVKFGELAKPLRAILTGRGVSPGLFDVFVVLGKEESLGRLDDILNV